MSLFLSLGKSLAKFAMDSASGIQYTNDKEIEDKGDDFLLHYQILLMKESNSDDRLDMVMGIATTGIFAAKADGKFSTNEGMEIMDFIEVSLSNEDITREEIYDIVLDISNSPIQMVHLGQIALKLQNRYGNLAIDVLRRFIEVVIYGDGEVHPKELAFLNEWEKTVELMG